MANLTATITLSAGTDVANDSLALTQTVALPVQAPSANIGRVDVTTGAAFEIRAASVATHSYVYIKNLQLAEANFSMDQVNVTIKSDDFTVIQSIIQGYNLDNEIPYEMYKKGDCAELCCVCNHEERSGCGP